MAGARLTAEEFERKYADASGVTVEHLRELGRVVKPCACGDVTCEGWQSVNAKDYEDDQDWARQFLRN